MTEDKSKKRFVGFPCLDELSGKESWISVCACLCFSEAAKAKPVSDEQEQMKSRLEKVEALNKTYEKNLKENAGHMLTVIEKMQKMVDQVKTGNLASFHSCQIFETEILTSGFCFFQTTSLTRTKDVKGD